jgi:hypothetical protein
MRFYKGMNSSRRTWGMIILFLIIPAMVFAQYEPKKLTVNGYAKFLQTVFYDDFDQNWLTDNLIHNRINVHWFPTAKINGVVEFRNRFFYGDFVKTIPDYNELAVSDGGFFDLSFNWAEGQSYLMNTTIDRIYMDYITGKFQARVGRQRINWSQNLVWNPNDVFNAYSYFDFDYEERPGTDAVKLQYYTGFTSYGEFVYQIGDSLEDMSFAGLYKFNKWNYDIQFLGGYVKNNWVVGTGWSGNIKGAAFRGEATYFYTEAGNDADKHQVVLSVSGDYTFQNQLYAQIGMIYNSLGKTQNIRFDEGFFFGGTSAKNLTPSRMELLGQVSFPFTPLINGNFATIVNPYDGSYFFGPGITFSVQKNLELLLFAQFFRGEDGTEYGDIGQLLYWRLRWSF